VTGIDEVMKIERTSAGGARYPLPGGAWRELTGNEVVSMTFFGFTPAFFGQVRSLLTVFLEKNGRHPTAEFYLPVAVGELLQTGHAEVRLLTSTDAWFGMTYRQDVPAARDAIGKLIAQGAYPERL
jgi:hypothetical protein